MSSNTSSAPEQGSIAKRFLRSFIFVFVGTALGLILLIFIAEDKFIYFPSSDGDWSIPEKSNGKISSNQLKTKDGLEIIAWYYKAAQPTEKTVLFFHGNAGNLTHRHGWAQALTLLPANVLQLDYRGYGPNKGKPSEEGLYLDAKSAYDFLRNEKGVKSEDLYIYGISLGGGVATETALRYPCAGLILQSTFTSAPDMAGTRVMNLPLGLFMSSQYASKDKVSKLNKPLMIIHSKDDELIPFYMAEELYRRAKEPKVLHPFVGAKHNDLLGQRAKELFVLFKEFIKKTN